MTAISEQEFRKLADGALESLKKSLIQAERSADFEVEENSGALKVVFEEPPATFVISPNFPVRQIWISALSTSFKLDWSPGAGAFVLEKTGEELKTLMARLINEQLGEQAVVLA